MRLSILFCLFAFQLAAQDYYFPPLTGDAWETADPESLDWCSEKLDSVYQFLDEKNTKAFIILQGGKIVAEEYFDSFTQDSFWYWASAGKTITAFLTGMLQEEGLLDIDDPAALYLGTGWTECPPDKENLITVWNQLTMTSGLDDGVPNNHCTLDTCLQYLADAGNRWAYHNAPYSLIQNVLEEASGQSINALTNQKLAQKTGMTGLWLTVDTFDGVFFSRARDMARFGSLIINGGVWNGDTLLHDQDYFDQMVNTSQGLNQSYGYLWWLNGKGSHMLPGLQLVFPTDLIPNAPDDLYAGLGKNDQKLYIIPSLDMVVVRMGNASGQPAVALSSFDNELWGLLMEALEPCAPSSVQEVDQKPTFRLAPNPTAGEFTLTNWPAGQPLDRIRIRDWSGRILLDLPAPTLPISVAGLEAGIYAVEVFAGGERVGVGRLVRSSQ